VSIDQRIGRTIDLWSEDCSEPPSFDGESTKTRRMVSHALSQNDKPQRSMIAAGLFAHHKANHGHKQRFLYRIVTGDKKWCVYVNMKQWKEWLSPKNKQHREQNKNFILRR